MKATRKFFGLGFIVYLVLAIVVLLGMLGSALASVSEPLILENATGDTLTVGSVSLVNDGTNLIIKFITDAEYPLQITALTFRGNTGGILHTTSAETTYLTHKSDNNHTFTIPLTQIKNDNVVIAASADVIVNGAVTNTRKAWITVFLRIPTTTTSTVPTTTSSTVPTTTSTTETTQTTTTTGGGGNGTTTTTTGGGGNGTTTTTTTGGGGNGGTTTTTRPSGGNGGVTTTVGAGTTSTTVVAGVTTTTIKPVATTVLAKVTREGLPFTGTQSNLYLGGLLLMLTGAGLFLGSLKRSNE
ncbi:MAG: hypothetical protein Q8J63_02705 [Candidatus Aquicultor sp.]|nr:hypothetical protein [Candidatus Aquicultor sp.]